MMPFTKMPGYTLIELLISVTIFTVIIILALAIFTQTLNDNNLSDATRQKTEAARSIVDQLTSDFQYLATDSAAPSTVEPPQCTTGTWDNGFCVVSSAGNNANTLYMMLKYANSSTYEEKEYLAVNDPSGNGFALEEWLVSCNNTINPVTHENDCTNAMTSKVSTGTNYLISSNTDGFVLDSESVFNGSMPDVVGSGTGQITTEGYLAVDVSVKSLDDAALSCSAKAGTCYELKTILTPGDLQ